MSVVAGLPEGLAGADLAAGRAWLEVEDALYPLEALYGAAYIFIDRCYVLLDRPQAGRLRVTLAPKSGAADETTLRALAGEFANELLSCAWRHEITKENRATIQAVTMEAIAGAMGPPSLDALSAFDLSASQFDDPLGIAMSWEEKYKKAKPAEEPAEEPAAAPRESGDGGSST
jgi:His-Xaa-Ser system protein HxsD